MYSIDELELKLLSELKQIGEELNLKKFKTLTKQELIYSILDHQAQNPGQVEAIKKRESKVEAKDLAQPETSTPKAAPAPKKQSASEGFEVSETAAPAPAKKSRFKREKVVEVEGVEVIPEAITSAPPKYKERTREKACLFV